MLRDAWQPSAGAENPVHETDVPAGERRRLIVRLRPVRRGDLTAPHITVRSFGPLRLAARQRTVQAPGSVRVLPPFKSRRHIPSKLRRLRELDGKAAVQIRGAGTEFDSLRDYVRGDDVRSIDWRATARRSAVMVRTWRPERDRRVVIMLDTSRTAAARVTTNPGWTAASKPHCCWVSLPNAAVTASISSPSTGECVPGLARRRGATSWGSWSRRWRRCRQS